MKTYSIGTNDYWFTASLCLDEVPIGLYFLEWIVSWMCYFTPSIPLPGIKFRLKNKYSWDYTTNNDGWTTLRDWFGDTQQLFHCHVCVPVHNFVWKHTKTIRLNLPYEFAREKFPDDCMESESDWDEDDIKFRIKTKELDDWSNDLFTNAYRTLDYKYKQKSI